ncbi:hypothetical protein F4821DRAFT_251461 [Hypoxylon rubiginosum]|uniref:Uncharacterized protein n=1 Tax=Hypoxylon rubiginosum TaxID=110542 RepID=A0ACC0CJ98_9PEZI|nr:hypothetical protein F4821DRAFT_251461 [Hypoxylon rubiginosum]
MTDPSNKKDDWREVTDPEERRRIQNRVNQRKYRERHAAPKSGGHQGNQADDTGPANPNTTAYGRSSVVTFPTCRSQQRAKGKRSYQGDVVHFDQDESKRPCYEPEPVSLPWDPNLVPIPSIRSGPKRPVPISPIYPTSYPAGCPAGYSINNENWINYHSPIQQRYTPGYPAMDPPPDFSPMWEEFTTDLSLPFADSLSHPTIPNDMQIADRQVQGHAKEHTPEQVPEHASQHEPEYPLEHPLEHPPACPQTTLRGEEKKGVRFTYGGLDREGQKLHDKIQEFSREGVPFLTAVQEILQ